MVKILTDSASDITLAEAIDMNVDMVPLRVNFGHKPYDQFLDADFTEFYRMLAQEKELPVTSQPSPADFLPVFSRAKKDGDSVVAILLSGAISGTVQSAHIARDMAEYDDIFIIDSRQAIMGQRLLVEYAVSLRSRGLTAAEIAIFITEASRRIRLYGAVDTLKYLRRGGRIPKTTELLGTALGIKPVLELVDGSLEVVGKARGNAGATTAMLKLVEEHSDFDPAAPVYFGYTATDTLCRNFQKLLCSRFKLKNTRICPVGGTVGTHIGPGAFAIAYLTRPQA